MNKKVLKAAFVAAIAMVSGINVFNAQKSEVLSDTALANVEALAELEGERKYAIKNEDTVEIWDDKTATYKKITVIDCEGKGSLSC